MPDALEYLLHEFTEAHSEMKTYNGYRLLAVDGSDLHTPTNPDDTDTFRQTSPDAKGYNLSHLNAMYDLCNKLYVDTLIQPCNQENGHKALVSMVQRSRIEGDVILTADRGYESYNDFAHIENKGWKYLVRVKDIGSNGILSGLRLPCRGEFDINVSRILTRKKTKEVKANPALYRILNRNATFDFFDDDECYHISYRIVRVQITDSTYETLITNLDSTEFFPEDLKVIYGMRWGIETSF